MILTLTKWAEQLAGDLNRPVDYMFINRLKDLIVQEYSTIIKQSIDRNGYDKSLTSSIFIPLERLVAPPIEKTKNNILHRTTCSVIRPVRHANQAQPFTFVGSEDGVTSFIPSSFEEVSFISHLPLVSEAIRYVYTDSYIYILSPTPIAKVKISAIFSDLSSYYEITTTKVGKFTSTNTGTKKQSADIELDIPLDIVNLVKFKLISEELRLETEVKPDITHVDNT